MPFTLSHPLAVVPLRRWCPARLNFAALVIGSMSPDFGYFISQFDTAAFAHTIPGTFAVCLPTSLLVLAIFYLIRRPLCFILPQPHRGALTPIALANPPLTTRGVFIAAVSVILGAWTHILWDSFTHGYGWPVRQIEFLHAPLIRIGNTEKYTYDVLQIVSTLVGGAGLILLYFFWLRRQPRLPRSDADSFSDRWRYGLLAAIVIATLAIAMTVAYRKVTDFEGHIPLEEFIYWTTVYSISVFFPLLTFFSIAIYATHRRKA